MNIWVFEKINGIANVSKILDFVGIFFADYFLYILGIILVVLFIWKRNRLMVISAAISVILSRLIITEIIRYFYHYPRPYVVLEAAKKLIAENQDYASFPSGHAAIFFAIAMAIYFFNKKLGIVFFVGAVLIGLARIFVGIHWPSDVLGGAIIGIISGIIINKLIIKFYKPKPTNS